ncbi:MULTISPECIES: hypothetical protein [unclassified Pseudomonas]|uniref:hypothetical protein n=1 Tax=unclassified Pseudomonas TaxID=196821 RepID=UPI000B68A350|nr:MULTISPECIES: hypothetical protein [Pseudomonas]SNT47213.1 hypothetical protein SAMN05660216_04744 [Pseudomonas sp. LAMO17WK12:I8]SNY39792.1 hypothetical protein SAMN05660344_04645 [Pseudomonas sp. LAMO17WK12:I11]SNY39924.1 hypothetical protein SAMN05660893_04603 [Pseudomonas sp. LAMO17WK12:I12]SNY40826.1 hypothetical protein SAMN05660700_04746 [Pseudomonas sp. LAMO17WK12:I7]
MRLFFLFGVLLGGLSTFYLALLLVAIEPNLGILINSNVVSLLKDVVGPVAAGFGGAIAGAYAAYTLQESKEKARSDRESAGAVSRARLVLVRCLSELTSLKKYHFYPHRDESLRFVMINLLPEAPVVEASVSDKFIDVLADIGAGPALDSVMLSIARYKACFENFSRRNQSLQEFRQAMQEGNFHIREEVSVENMVEAYGAPRLMAMYRNTEEIIVVLDEAIATLNAAIELTTNVVSDGFKGSGLPQLMFKIHDAHLKFLEPLPAPKIQEEEMYKVVYACAKAHQQTNC